MADSSPAKLAVLGSPIAHSKSPLLHAAAYQELGLDWTYGSERVEADELPAFVAGLGPDWRGLSLTMPLKRAAVALADDIDDTAADTGQANTLLLTDGRIRAANTDIAGIRGALADAGLAMARRGVVLGGGATAVSAVRALELLGATPVVAVRDVARVRSAGSAFGDRPEIDLYPIGETARLIGDADVVISTIPGGVELPFELPELDPAQTLLDVVYEPDPTPLVAAWRGRGGRVAPGIGMLIHQALRQVRMFVGGDIDTPLPDETRVLRAMRAAVGGS